MPLYKSPPEKSRHVLIKKISKSVLIPRTRILPIRISLISAVLSIILMLLVIEILISTQIGLPLLASILLCSLTFTTILRESTRKRK